MAEMVRPMMDELRASVIKRTAEAAERHQEGSTVKVLRAEIGELRASVTELTKEVAGRHQEGSTVDMSRTEIDELKASVTKLTEEVAELTVPFVEQQQKHRGGSWTIRQALEPCYGVRFPMGEMGYSSCPPYMKSRGSPAQLCCSRNLGSPL